MGSGCGKHHRRACRVSMPTRWPTYDWFDAGVADREKVQKLKHASSFRRHPNLSTFIMEDIACTGTVIPFIPFKLHNCRRIMYIYFSTLQLPPISNIGEVGDIYIRRIRSSGYDPSSIEVYWKGYRKDSITKVWREILPNSEEIQHPLYTNLYLQGFPAFPLRPEWRRKGTQQQGQGDIKYSAGNFLKIHERGSISNPIILS